MKLADWLKDDIEKLPVLGKESFNTFLKVCSTFAKWALDDISLAIKNDKYKIWTCPVKYDQIKDVKAVLERYNSMRKLLHYYNVNIVENRPIAFYMSIDFLNNKWVFEYGISNGNKLYIAGKFQYTITTELPDNEIVKYVKAELDNFNSREHLLLYTIRKDMMRFNPGYCQITEPIILNKTVMMTTYNLGIWNDSGMLENGEKEDFLQLFRKWALPFKWASLVILIVRPQVKKSVDFIIKLK